MMICGFETIPFYLQELKPYLSYRYDLSTTSLRLELSFPPLVLSYLHP